jgi:hypothetical protein
MASVNMGKFFSFTYIAYSKIKVNEKIHPVYYRLWINGWHYGPAKTQTHLA